MSDQKDKDQIKESDSNLQTEELEKVVENINSSEHIKEDLGSEEHDSGQEEKEEKDEDRILRLEEEITSLKDQYLRFMAEAENNRKRNERHLSEAHKYGIAGFARSILTVADDLSRALQAIPEEQKEGEGLLQTLLGGVEAVERQLQKIMEDHNIKQINPVGEQFDPNFHEAMYEVPDSEFPDGVVAQVIQPGYNLHDRLIRPARVGVAKGALEDPEALKK